MQHEQYSLADLSAEQLQRIIHMLPVGVFRTTVDGKCIFVNERWCAITGRSSADAMGDGWANIVHPDDRASVYATWTEALRTGTDCTIDYRILAHDGTTSWVTVRVTGILDGEGKLSGFCGILMDISERKEHEALARQHEMHKVALESIELLRAIADNSPMLIYARDIDRRYVFCNRGCENLIGRPAAEILGKTAHDFVPDVVADFYDATDREVFTNERPLEIEDRFPGPDGDLLYLTTKFPIRDGLGKVVAVGGISVDVTLYRRAEIENRRLQEEMLRVQGETLRALSMPLIPIADGVLAMPLIGAMDQHRARQIIETMLRGVATQRARIAILDLTGVPTADAAAVDALVQTARAVRLLGADVVLSGIRPELAHALLALGVSLEGMVTRSTLQDAIAYALQRRG